MDVTRCWWWWIVSFLLLFSPPFIQILFVRADRALVLGLSRRCCVLRFDNSIPKECPFLSVPRSEWIFSSGKRAFHHLNEISIDILLISHLNRIIRLLSWFPPPRRFPRSILIQFQSPRCWLSVFGSLRFALKWFSSASAWTFPQHWRHAGEEGEDF